MPLTFKRVSQNGYVYAVITHTQSSGEDSIWREASEFKILAGSAWDERCLATDANGFYYHYTRGHFRMIYDVCQATSRFEQTNDIRANKINDTLRILTRLQPCKLINHVNFDM